MSSAGVSDIPTEVIKRLFELFCVVPCITNQIYVFTHTLILRFYIGPLCHCRGRSMLFHLRFYSVLEHIYIFRSAAKRRQISIVVHMWKNAEDNEEKKKKRKTQLAHHGSPRCFEDKDNIFLRRAEKGSSCGSVFYFSPIFFVIYIFFRGWG